MPRTLDDLWEPPPAYQKCPVCGSVIATMRDYHRHRLDCLEPYLAEERRRAEDSTTVEIDRSLVRQRQKRIEEALR